MPLISSIVIGCHVGVFGTEAFAFAFPFPLPVKTRGLALTDSTICQNTGSAVTVLKLCCN